MERLSPIAATLGADMPFCLRGGTALGTGFGERIEPLAEDDARMQALRASGCTGRVLVGAYRAQLSTPEVYAAFDVLGPGGGPNDLQQAAISLHPRSGVAVDAALGAGASAAFVSGSGPSVVAFAPDQLRRRRCSAHGYRRTRWTASLSPTPRRSRLCACRRPDTPSRTGRVNGGK